MHSSSFHFNPSLLFPLLNLLLWFHLDLFNVLLLLVLARWGAVSLHSTAINQPPHTYDTYQVQLVCGWCELPVLQGGTPSITGEPLGSSGYKPARVHLT